MEQKKTVRAAIYLRVSRDRDNTGLAIDRQREDCIGIINRRQWELYETYVDSAISAASSTVTRPAYQRMIQDVEAGFIDAVVCWDLDRLTRQPRELEEWIERATTRGLTLVTANGEADLTTDAGRLFARIKASVARSEVDRKAARQRRANVQRAQQGKRPNGSRPMGYHDDLRIYEEEAEIVRAMYRHAADGKPLGAIRQALTGRDGVSLPGLPVTPRRRYIQALEANQRRVDRGQEPRPLPPQQPWDTSSITAILRSPRYAGFSIYRPAGGPTLPRSRWREGIVRDAQGQPVMGKWEPLVSLDLWEAVQARLDGNAGAMRRSRPGGSQRTLLGGSLYRCEICGGRMISRSQGYRCEGDGSGPWHMSRRRGPIDALVRAVVSGYLAREADALRVRMGAEAGQADRLGELRAEIATHERRIARAQADYDLEIIEGPDLKRVRSTAEDAITALESEIASLMRHSALGGVLGGAAPSAIFLEAGIETQREIIDALVTITLLKQPPGSRKFDPASVRFEWKI